MNLEKLLAENMLRFGVKNLNTSNKNSIILLKEAAFLMEQGGAAFVRDMDAKEKAIVEQVKAVNGFNGWGDILSFLKSEGILFNFEVGVAADWILLGYIRKFLNEKILKRYVKRPEKFDAAANALVLSLNDTIATNVGQGAAQFAEYQFNQSPENGKNILTLGKITAAGLDKTVGQTYASDSNLEELCRWANTYNVVNCQTINPGASGYEMGKPEVNKNGALDIANSFLASEDPADIWFYSLKGYTPPAAKTTSATVTPAPLLIVGDVTETKIDAQYEPLVYKPSDAALKELLDVLTNARKLGELIDLTVIGSASTEKINLTSGQALIDYWKTKNQPGADKFVSNASGLQGEKLPPDNVIAGSGTKGDVTSDMASGNAFLANLRKREILNFLNKKGFPVDFSKAEIADGEVARNIRVQFKIKAPDTKQIIEPKVVLNTIGTAGKTVDYGAVFKCRVADIDLY